MQENILMRARRYLGTMPPAVAGSGGDATTYKVAVVLVKGFSLPPAQALPLFTEWNAACVPPWTEGQLRAKLASAARSAAPAGYLLKDRTGPANAGAKKPARRADRQGRNPDDPAPASATKCHGAPAATGTDKAGQRRQWPAFQKPTAADLAAIAVLRGVSVEAIAIIASHGHLWRCRWRGEESLVIRKGTFAQVRRMDGRPFTRQDGTKVKALNLCGSEGAFLNPGGMGADDVPVILTEGAISILEAAEAILRADASPSAGTLHPVAVLAAVSACSRFTAGHLRKLAGRRVRIIPDHDPAGQEAAANWSATLRTAGCAVDAIRLPAGSKDLGDALRAIPATDSFWQQLLTF